MKRQQSKSTAMKETVFCFFLFALLCNARADNPPFTVLTGIYDQSKPTNLGLTRPGGIETYTIFAPVDSTDHYSNGVVMVAFKDTLYCQWQSSETNEDSDDTWVAYSKSTDGKTWTDPMEIAATLANGKCSSGGWWVNGDTLVAYINVWPNSVWPRGGFTYYKSTTDGINWSDMKPVLMANGDTMNGIFEQDPHRLPGGRIINAAHFQTGLRICPIYTDDSSGVRGWNKGDYTILSVSDNISREIEPSWYLRSDDTIVMIFRDQDGTFKKLASISGDNGETWSTSVLTNMPDARTKQCAGNIGDSTAYMVGNPVNNSTRIPLVITLSKDGQLFNTAYLLREGGDSIQPIRYSGTAKRSGYHYPKSMIYKDTLYVSYSTNKEDVEYSRIPLDSLVLDTITVIVGAPSLSVSNTIEISINTNGILKVSNNDNSDKGLVSIYNIQGQLLYRGKMNDPEMYYDMRQHPAGAYIVDVRTGIERKTQLISNLY
ncbi:MAG: exo-alpha-sialidase [Bacteroidales bacterium]|nr:exo-alpha-sialidase [Bacteroidales bacterium]